MPNAAAPKRKQTHIPSDFKRRKAKVGKRAVTPANETNVKFKAVTVGVRSQNAVLAQKTSGAHFNSGVKQQCILERVLKICLFICEHFQ